MRPRCCHSIKNQNSAREDVNISLHLANRPLLPDLHGKVEMRDSNRTFYLGTSPALVRTDTNTEMILAGEDEEIIVPNTEVRGDWDSGAI